MTTAITPVAQYAGTLTRADDGELAGMSSGPAPLGTLLQVLADRGLYARGSLWGNLTWNGRLSVSGTAAVPVVVVGPIDAVALCDAAGTWRPYFVATETTLGIADVEGAPANLAASTWYYVYAWSDAAAPGAVKFQISSTPPTEAGTPTVLQQYRRTETANYRYLGCFVTDAAGNPIPCLGYRGRYRFRFCDTNDVQVLSSGSAIAATDVLCAAAVPPHVRNVLLLASVSTTIAAQGNSQVFEKGTATAVRLPTSHADGTALATELTITTDTAQTVQYVCNAATTDIDLHVLGFDE